jgi:hypothetical protein
LAVGDPGWRSDEGAVFIYKFNRTTGLWDYQSIIQIQSSAASRGDQFAWSISMNDGLLAVGAPDRGVDNSGSVYIYRREGEDWREIRKITPSNFNPGFGIDLDLDDNRLIVGAYKNADFYTENYVGTAYFYDLSLVTASDGEYSNYTRVNWDFPNSPLVKSFNIYRSIPGGPKSGEEPIATVSFLY